MRERREVQVFDQHVVASDSHQKATLCPLTEVVALVLLDASVLRGSVNTNVRLRPRVCYSALCGLVLVGQTHCSLCVHPDYMLLIRRLKISFHNQE